MASTVLHDSRALPGVSSVNHDAQSEMDTGLDFNEDLALDTTTFFPPGWSQAEEGPVHDGLYPLDWASSDLRGGPHPSGPYPQSALSASQQEELCRIAMPRHPKYRDSQSPKSTASLKSRSMSSPENPNDVSNRKRKTSAEEDKEDDDGLNPPKKTSHNMIEKRYRTNLNDKIAALRDSVPSLRIMSKSARGEDTADDRADLQGLTPAHKLNKATVLSKATEYINHLEKRNRRLEQENAEQRARITAFETLFRAGSMGHLQKPPVNNPFQYAPDFNAAGPSPADAQGMIQVPEDIRRLHGQGSQQIYPVPQEYYAQRTQHMAASGWSNSGFYGKLMVGSLAGLMMLEGFSESDQDDDSPNRRGLFALPAHLLQDISSNFHSYLDFNMLGYHVSAVKSLWYLKLMLVLAMILCAYLPSLFAKGAKSKGGKASQAALAPAPSVASTIQVRRQAWLTAIQTVWVPRHNFFLEATALCLKMVKLSLRNLVGVQGYAYITGITQQQEAARVKAWSIALDAQLAGGDVEVNKTRLTLTLLASCTLPDTPARLMLKALHIRVLLWEFGKAGFSGYFMFREVAGKIARWQWNEAKHLQRLLAHSKTSQDEKLPDYLAALLEQECDDVLVDEIGQRAYNLTWNLPTTQNSSRVIDGMDSVINDSAIRSPLDAVAAWFSTMILHGAIAKSLESSVSEDAAQEAITSAIELALQTAPIGSGSQLRALVARAVLIKDKRGENVTKALHVLGPSGTQAPSTDTSPAFIDASTSQVGQPDIQLSIRCAIAIAHLNRLPAPANPEIATKYIRAMRPVDLTLLSFAALFKLMEHIDGHQVVAISCTNSFERLAGALRIWIGSKHGEKSGLDKAARKQLGDRCLDTTKRIIGMEDAGYQSMSDEENY